jgi:hypothetical protein
VVRTSQMMSLEMIDSREAPLADRTTEMLIGCLLHSGGNCGGPIGKNGRWWEREWVKGIEGDVDSEELI